MLIRPHGDGTLAIGQPAHAWVSGQIARAWGNQRFGGFEPWEEVCLGAEQHDAGMAGWDVEPDLNPATGLPYSFMELPLPTHLRLWSGAYRRVLPQSRYAALLTSMHGTALYERRDLGRMDPDAAAAVRTFLDEQHGVQEELTRSLRAGGAAVPGTEPAAIARNRRLVWTWDSLSLAICLGWDAFSLRDVPAAGGETVDLAFEPLGDDRFALDPWPFAADRVALRTEGRLLRERYGGEAELHAALASAEWLTVQPALVPAG